MASRAINLWRSLDWITILIYLVLVVLGWLSIYAASYDFNNASIFDFDERSGKQLIWIGLSLLLGFVLVMLDVRFYESFAIPIYGCLMFLLLITVFIAPDIKGSHSWLVLGPVSLQPAEFAKFATSLALAKLLSSYNFTLQRQKDFFRAIAFVLLPMLLIIMQKETGSALVYGALIFMFYREGMSSMIPFAAICAIVYFVFGLKFSHDMAWEATPLGLLIVLSLIYTVMVAMVAYQRQWVVAISLLVLSLVVGVASALLIHFGIIINLLHLIVPTLVIALIYLLLIYIKSREPRWIAIFVFAIASLLFTLSVDYVFLNVMQPHQQKRIEVALGMKDDLRGAGYNVNQSKIAIGSGGVLGKGYLNGTQTKLKYVPEQDTDFIFCTIGEEKGFLGTTTVLILFTTLILRIVYLAERQRTPFGRVYAYCVASILFFHLAINVGMVIGLCPVIGIPLPFFSYGGSSLWGFSILLFVLLRIDASRMERY